jgi:cytochrome P450/glutathione S-transferase
VATTTIYRPRIASSTVTPYSEIVRWVLDRQAIPYSREDHAPGFHSELKVDTGETALLGADSIVAYYELRAPLKKRLFPVNKASAPDARELFTFCLDSFGTAVQAWTTAYLLHDRQNTIRTWTRNVPLWERVAVQLFYPWIAKSVRGKFQIGPGTIEQQERVIEETFTRIEARLKDGRRFLLGDTFSAPDLAFAALAGLIFMPAQYVGSLPEASRLPSAMRQSIDRWRVRPAGGFVMRLYQEERGGRAPDLIAEGKHGSGETLADKVANLLIRPGVLRPIFSLLRRFSPILVIGKRAIVTRYDDVIEVLKRDTDFTIAQVNAPKIDQVDGPFILGMDESPQYDLEKQTLHEAARREDLERIRQFVATSAADLIAAARPHGRIDVVHGLARVVALRLVAAYCGMPGPDEATMMRWMRDIFHYVFADLTNSKSVLHDALQSGSELRPHMDAQILLRQSKSTGKVPAEDMLGRLIAMQDGVHPWLDNHAIRRNLAGVIVGAVDTTSKFVTLAIDELLRRPQALAEAQNAAMAGDIETVKAYAWEAVRFNPHHPLQVRYCAKEMEVASGQPRAKKIPAGSFVYALTFSGMFDPSVFVDPDRFDVTRNVEYLHFGFGMHTCFGKAINSVQIPELLAALLRLPNLRRATGGAGQIVYDGPFPDRLVLQFGA